MNSLNYLIKNDLNRELDNLIDKHIKMSQEYDGKTCKKCGLIQGTAHKGVRNAYCEHITLYVDRRLKKEKEKITKKIFFFTSCSSSHEAS